MSLSSHDRNVLARISADLTGSDPDLAGMLGTFAQLTAADDLPAREQLRPHWPRAWRRLRAAQLLILVWLLVTAAMIAVAVSLSGSGTASCNPLWAQACAGPTPAMTAHAPSAS